MKAKATRETPPAAFVPVKLEIIFESQDELDQFYTVANSVKVGNALVRQFGRDFFGAFFGGLNEIGARSIHTDNFDEKFSD